MRMRMRMRILKDDHGYDALGFLDVEWQVLDGTLLIFLYFHRYSLTVPEYNLFTIKLGGVSIHASCLPTFAS